MSNYTTLSGYISNEEDDDSLIYINNLPKSANDLKSSAIPLQKRQSKLNILNKIKTKIKEIEICLITGSKRCNKDIEKLKKVLDINRIDVSCEMDHCVNNTIIYRNICEKCLKITKGEGEMLMVIRNICLRVGFLEHQLSSSLANRLNNEELNKIIVEINILSKLL